jgi:hypothetical protein
MAAVSTCVNHPTKTATHRCKRCSKPICAQCVQMTDLGQFCSQECYKAVQDFQAKVMDLGPGKKGGFDLGKMVRGVVSLAVVLGILYACFYYGFGDKTPEAMIRRVKLWVGMP